MIPETIKRVYEVCSDAPEAEKYYTLKQLTEVTGVSWRVLNKWRAYGLLKPSRKLITRFLYSIEDFNYASKQSIYLENGYSPRQKSEFVSEKIDYKKIFANIPKQKKAI